MATKKSSRKKKNSTSRRNIIFLIISALLLVIVALVLALAVNYANKANDFSELENEIRQVNASVGNKGRLSNWCDGPNTVFPTTDSLDCGTTLELDNYDIRLIVPILDKLKSLNYQISEDSADERGNTWTSLQNKQNSKMCVIKSTIETVGNKTDIFVTCFAPSNSWLDGYERR